MRIAFLLLAHDADVGGFLRTARNRTDLAVVRNGDGAYQLVKYGDSGDGTLLVRFTPGSTGWIARLSLENHENHENHPSLVPALARTLPVRALRLLATGPAARTLAVYTWWGPGTDPERGVVEYRDDTLGLRVRATFAGSDASNDPTDADDWRAGEAGPPAAPLPCLEADVQPAMGTLLRADRIASFFEQVDRALDYRDDDPVRAILEGETVSEPPTDGDA